MIKKTNLYKTITLVVLVLSITLLPVTSFALNVGAGACDQNSSAPCAATADDIGVIIGKVISLLLFISGAIAALVIVIGGIRYITSDGDPGSTSKAKNTIIYALVGLVLATMSYAIVNFVISRL